MRAVDLLRRGAEYGHAEFLKSLEGLEESAAWATICPTGDEYLHTDGSVQGLVLHVATGKRMYGSICFRATELRWRDVAEELDSIEPSWPKALEYLEMCHRYWMESWADLEDDRLEEPRPTNFKEPWPAWRIIQMVNHHDSYHAGQVAMVRYAGQASAAPPPTTADDIRQYCRESVHW